MKNSDRTQADIGYQMNLEATSDFDQQKFKVSLNSENFNLYRSDMEETKNDAVNHQQLDKELEKF